MGAIGQSDKIDTAMEKTISTIIDRLLSGTEPHRVLYFSDTWELDLDSRGWVCLPAAIYPELAAAISEREDMKIVREYMRFRHVLRVDIQIIR